jgi:hypothetical protein
MYTWMRNHLNFLKYDEMSKLDKGDEPNSSLFVYCVPGNLSNNLPKSEHRTLNHSFSHLFGNFIYICISWKLIPYIRTELASVMGMFILYLFAMMFSWCSEYVILPQAGHQNKRRKDQPQAEGGFRSTHSWQG